jgi:hypothetical protein
MLVNTVAIQPSSVAEGTHKPEGKLTSMIQTWWTCSESERRCSHKDQDFWVQLIDYNSYPYCFVCSCLCFINWQICSVKKELEVNSWLSSTHHNNSLPLIFVQARDYVCSTTSIVVHREPIGDERPPHIVRQNECWQRATKVGKNERHL